MSDRRPLFAIGLILLIAIVPSILLRRPTPPVTGSGADSLAVDSSAQVAREAPPVIVPQIDTAKPLASADTTLLPEDTVVVRSGLYRFGISTRGGRLVSVEFLRYKTLDPAVRGDTLQLLPAGAALLDAQLAMAGDTVRVDRVAFTPSLDSLTVSGDSSVLTLTGQAGEHAVSLSYTFYPDQYHFHVAGAIGAMDPSGGTMLIGMGDGFQNTEANVVENHRESGVVTKLDKTRLTRFSSLKPRQPNTMSGPFEWAAVKSKYFVAGVFASDSSRPKGSQGLIGGVTAFPPDTASHPVRAEVTASLLVPSTGRFAWEMYLGPMEYDRLKAMGHEFDDVNPYGWAWLRPVIRPFAVLIRWVFVQMHETLGLGYGLVIVLFGIMVRILLWPLNQKAMRSMMAMQAIQPELQAIQKRYKEEPQRLQQEMFKLYKEHNVNPFGGCWPMLIPYPMLVAVFFVLGYTIEVRGVHFLWMMDLARPDPLYIIPVVMAVSMFGVSKIGQMGMPPNPQAKMMMYVMPGMMLFLFANFASGLNLYYAVQNLASIPQQWMIMKERRKLMEARGGGGKVVVGKKK